MKTILTYLILTIYLFSYILTHTSNKNKYTCTDSDRKANCNGNKVDKVCGWFGPRVKCTAFPCSKEYDNKCKACLDKTINYTTIGSCKQFNKAG